MLGFDFPGELGLPPAILYWLKRNRKPRKESLTRTDLLATLGQSCFVLAGPGDLNLDCSHLHHHHRHPPSVGGEIRLIAFLPLG